jgi:hypothetical protein
MKLVAGEYVPIAVQRPHVRPHVRDRLCAIHQNPGAGAVSYLNLPIRRCNGSQRVRHLRKRYQPGLQAEQLAILLQDYLPGIVHRSDTQPRAFFVLLN